MNTIKRLLIACFILTSGQALAQKDRAVYYFLDAVSADTASAKTYLYSFPVTKTTVSRLNSDRMLAEFKEQLKSKYGISGFSSAVVRTNDSYEEARNLLSRYIEKYKEQGYILVKVD